MLPLLARRPMAPLRAVAVALLALHSARGADALANGLGKTPPLGWCVALPVSIQPERPAGKAPRSGSGSGSRLRLRLRLQLRLRLRLRLRALLHTPLTARWDDPSA